MAQTLLPKNLIDSVEGTLQRATLDGMRVHTAVGRAETGASRFSVQSILFYCDIAAGLIASRVEAEALRPLFETRAPGDGPNTLPGGSGQFSIGDTLRLRGVTPSVSDNLARRRTSASNDYYTSRDANPTPEYPAYFFEGGRFYISDGSSENPSGSEASFVTAPLTTASVETGVSLTGDTLGTTSFLGEKHEQTILRVANDSSQEQTLRLLDAPAGTVDTTLPDGSYDLRYFDHACSKLGRRHKAAVVEFASALCFASLGEGDALEASLSNFSDEVQADIMPAFDLTDEQS